MTISATRGLCTLCSLLAISLFWAGCADNPVTPAPDHFEARGLVLQQEGQDVVIVDSNKVTGEIALVTGAGEEEESFSILFIDEEDGSRSVPDDSDTDQSLNWTIADSTIAIIQRVQGQGRWNFSLRGLKRGETTVIFHLMHGDHPDFTSVPVRIRVMEKPSGIVLDMGGTEVVRVEGSQMTGQIEVPVGEESDRIEVWFLNQDGSLFQPQGGKHSLAFSISNTSVARVSEETGNPWSFRITGQSSGGTTLRIRLQHGMHDDYLSPEILIVTS